MFAEYQTLSVSLTPDAIVLMTMSRPDAANALNTHMAQELEQAFSIIAKHPGQHRAVILTGAGRHFCAGADLKERKGVSEKEWHAQHFLFERAQRAILHCPVPVIAAVNGAAMGGGLELALACDFIYAAKDARFALREATLGIMPGLGGTQFLTQAVGMSRAKELIFKGQDFTGEEAKQWGMVNTVCAPEELLPEVMAAAHIICANAPLAVRAIKQAINQGVALPTREALACELTQYHTLLHTKDRHEGINAFNEKRKPVFSGE